MSYDLEITRTAEKQLARMPPRDQRRIVRAVLELADEPRPPGCRKLSGFDDVYRLRVGLYRVIYSVSDRTLVVLVFKIGQRGDVYHR